MRRFLVGLLFGSCLSLPSALAYRISRPPIFTEWTPSSFAQLNDVLLQIFNVINGRYSLDISTSDPDGSRRCTKGELVLYDPGASEELCVCVDGSTDWDCSALSP